TVGDEYRDPGATAFDDDDGDLTDAIIVDNPVYPKTIGAYTVTYEVADSAGNKVTASRMVQVRARDAGGGGGGAFGVGFVLAGLLTAAWRRAGRGARQAARRTLRLGSPPR